MSKDQVPYVCDTSNTQHHNSALFTLFLTAAELLINLFQLGVEDEVEGTASLWSRCLHWECF